MSRKDRETIQQCLNGHPEEYRQLVRRYQGTLMSFLSGRLGDCERAEEAAQETFVRAYFSLKKLKKPESYFSWILGIADRVSREEQRLQGRLKPLDPSDLEQPGAPEPSRDEELEKAVSRLPAPYREVILLRYYGGRSCSEVAEHLGYALGTVTKRLSKAHALLRESLSASGQGNNRSEVPS